MIIQINNESILIDDEDFIHLQNSKSWRFIGKKKKYLKLLPCYGSKEKPLTFHRIIMSADKNMYVDHVNGDTRDNRKENLRIVTCKQNRRNSVSKRGKSKFKGVSECFGKWRAQIGVDYKMINLGRYDTEEEAAYVYDLASLKYHGEFGRRNFLPLA